MPLELTWLIPAFPLAASLLIVLFGQRLAERGGWLALAGGGLSLGLALPIAWRGLGLEEPFTSSLPWFSVGQFQLRLGIYLDPLASLLLIVVSLVSSLVLLYSIAYMRREGARLRRYYAEMSLFLGAMLALVLADNYLELYLFWELVGLCSYLLIGFWFERPSAAAAAIKAFLVTRLGDLFFLAGLLLFLVSFKTLGFTELFALQTGPDRPWVLGLGTIFIFAGAMGKSAQFPLHIWLPDAMEGPTTVSALIHAATMVNAGVYLVARTMPLLIQAPENLLFIALLGGFTALFAATMAAVNTDIKRVLAYSTISQLGYMFLGLGAGGFAYALVQDGAGYTAGLLHLMNHAFFKALLFLGAGAVMHAMGDSTDLRSMGALWPKLKLTGTAMLLGALANAGIPPTSGFWSKDEILTAAQAGGQPLLFMAWLFGLVTVFLTAFYIFRLWFLAFAGRPRWPSGAQPHEAPPLMVWPLAILGLLALSSGFVVFGSLARQVSLGERHLLAPGALLVETFTNPWTLLSIGLALAGLGIAYLLYQRGLDLARYRSALGMAIHRLLLERYYLDRAALFLARKATVGCARALDRFDRAIVDGLINGIGRASAGLGQQLRRTVTGSVSDYASWVVAGVAVFLLIYVLWR